MTTRAQLESDVGQWMVRTDYDFSSILKLCEARIRREVRIRAMETASDLTLSAQSVSLPTGFLEGRRIYLDGQSRELQYFPPEQFYKLSAYTETGTPVAYTIEGENIIFAPIPSNSPTAKLLYLKAFDALSDPGDTNWLLTNAYDVYLYCCLAEAKAWVEDDEQLLKWGRLYDGAVRELKKSEGRSRRIGPLKRVPAISP